MATNVALASNGATASASSQYGADYAPSYAIDGVDFATLPNYPSLIPYPGEAWQAGLPVTHSEYQQDPWGVDDELLWVTTVWSPWVQAGSIPPEPQRPYTYSWVPVYGNPQWLQVDFATSYYINSVVVRLFPSTAGTDFAGWGHPSNFEIQWWNGSYWVTAATVWDNYYRVVTCTFAAITTSRIRVYITTATDTGYPVITEIEAWTAATNTPVTIPVQQIFAIGSAPTLVESSGVPITIQMPARGMLMRSYAPTVIYQAPVVTVSDTEFDLWLRQGIGKAVVLCNLGFTYQGTVSGGGTPENVAGRIVGGLVTASSTRGGPYFADALNDADTKGSDHGAWGTWCDGKPRIYPTIVDGEYVGPWVQVDFLSATINKLVLVSLQDGPVSGFVYPDDSLTFTESGVTDFIVYGWDGADWVSLATVHGNNLVKRTVTFSEYTTNKVRIHLLNSAHSSGYMTLVEVQVWSSAGATMPMSGTAHLSKGLYVTGKRDTPASTRYIDCIASLPNYSRSIDTQSMGGRVTVNFSDMVINNKDGCASFLLDAIIDGQSVEFLLGDSSWPIASFRKVFIAVARVAEVTAPGEITVRLRDGGMYLDRDIVGNLIGGVTNNANKPRPITLGTFSQCEAFLENSARLRYRFAEPEYYVYIRGVWHTTTASQVYTVRSNGVRISPFYIANITHGPITWHADTDTIEFGAPHGIRNGQVVWITWPLAFPYTKPCQIISGHNSGLDQYWVVNKTDTTIQLALDREGTMILDITEDSTIAIDAPAFMTFVCEYYFDHMDGSLTMTDDPQGATITVSFENKYFGHSNSGTAEDGFYWAGEVAGLSGASVVGPHPSFYDPTQELNPPIALYIGQRDNLSNVMGKIALAANAFWGFDRLCRLTWGRVRTNPLDLTTDYGGFNTAAMSFTDDDIMETKGRISVSRLAPLYRYVSAWVGLTYPPLTNLGAAAAYSYVQVTGTVVENSEAALLKAKGYLEKNIPLTNGSYATTPWAYHTTMVDSPEMDVIIAGQESTVFSRKWVQYYRDRLLPHIEIASFTAPFRAYTLELGDKVSAYMPRACGHTASTDWQITEVSINLTEFTVDLTMIRRRVPDSTTTVH